MSDSLNRLEMEGSGYLSELDSWRSVILQCAEAGALRSVITAIEDLIFVSALFREDSRAWAHLANARSLYGQYAAASECLKKARACQPNLQHELAQAEGILQDHLTCRTELVYSSALSKGQQDRLEEACELAFTLELDSAINLSRQLLVDLQGHTEAWRVLATVSQLDEDYVMYWWCVKTWFLNAGDVESRKQAWEHVKTLQEFRKIGPDSIYPKLPTDSELRAIEQYSTESMAMPEDCSLITAGFEQDAGPFTELRRLFDPVDLNISV